MFDDFLRQNINGAVNPQAGRHATKIPALVQVGFSQVEPNHLSAQRTSQVYAQLPAAANIDLLQQGQFVKYDYANGVVNFTGAGEWMLVYNEIKLYRDFQNDCEFALIKDNYQARIYSPFGGAKGNTIVGINGVANGADWKNTDLFLGKQSRYYNGVDNEGKTGYTFGEDKEATYKQATEYVAGAEYFTHDASNDTYTKVAVADAADFNTYSGTLYTIDTPAQTAKTYAYNDVTAAPDMYEMHYTEDPFHIYGLGQELRMPEGTQMVPRVFKTNVGDIFTTNAIDTAIANLTVGAQLKIRTTGDKVGFLAADGDDASGMIWQVAKIYTMPDHQPGVKVMRIA